MRATNYQAATAQLHRGHDKIRYLLRQFNKTHDPQEQEDLFTNLSLELSKHVRAEEFALHTVAKILADKSAIETARETLTYMKLIIARLQRLTADDDAAQFNQYMSELKTAIDMHIQFEEELVFPMMEISGLDLVAIGKQMQALEIDVTAIPAPNTNFISEAKSAGQ